MKKKNEKKNEETKEVATKESTEVSTQPTQTREDILNSDVTIPRLMLMQGLSKFVASRQAQLGDMVRSTNAEKIGTPDSRVDFIPLTFYNKWLIQEIIPGNQKPVFVRFETRNAKNEHAEWDYKEGERSFKRMKVIELFALLPADIAKADEAKVKFEKTGDLPDLDATLMPIVITFRGMSYKAGNAVVTHFTKALGLAAQLNTTVKPHGYLLSLHSTSAKNEKGDFFIFDVVSAGKAKSEHVAHADHWCNILRQPDPLKVDEYTEDSVDKPAPMAGNEQF